MLDEIRAAGETIPEACEIFNANLEMSGDDIMFQDVIEVRVSDLYGFPKTTISTTDRSIK